MIYALQWVLHENIYGAVPAVSQLGTREIGALKESFIFKYINQNHRKTPAL